MVERLSLVSLTPPPPSANGRTIPQIKNYFKLCTQHPVLVVRKAKKNVFAAIVTVSIPYKRGVRENDKKIKLRKDTVVIFISQRNVKVNNNNVQS
jgi:hypothetical protein